MSYDQIKARHEGTMREYVNYPREITQLHRDIQFLIEHIEASSTHNKRVGEA